MDDTLKLSEKEDSIFSGGGALKYDFMISLQKIAMARIASNLWMSEITQQKIVDVYQQHDYEAYGMHFYLIDEDITAQVLQLSLPNSICQELKYLVLVLKDFLIQWITYHDIHVFSTEESRYSAVHLIRNIAWTVRGKIDYLQTAKCILADTNNGLSDDQKYKLACTYCLEDEIAVLINKFYLSYIEIQKNPMVYFWTAHITGDVNLLNNPPQYRDPRPYYYINRNCRHRIPRNSQMSYYERLMWLLIRGPVTGSTLNIVPIQFMWNKLSEEEKAKNISLVFKYVDNPDFKISLLSKLDYDQQQNILRECSPAVLSSILKEWWWWEKCFFPTALNVLDTVDPESFLKILHAINEEKQTSTQTKMYDTFKSLFKWLWEKGSREVKDFIFHDHTVPLKQILTRDLCWRKDRDAMEVIVNDLNNQQKKNLAFNEIGIQGYASFIKYHDVGKVDIIMNLLLSSEEDRNLMKQTLIEERGKEIAIHFFEHGNLDKMQIFVNWAFKSEKEISNFWKSLNYDDLPFLTQ